MQRDDAMELKVSDRIAHVGHPDVIYRVVSNNGRAIMIEREDNGERTSAPAYKFWMMHKLVCNNS